MPGQLWIEPVGDIIVARVRGIPTAELLIEAQSRILSLVRETGKSKVLYDALEMEAPSVEVPLTQQKLDRDMEYLNLRRAIVVPNTRLAYLARLAFADCEHRVFYNELGAAISWLCAH